MKTKKRPERTCIVCRSKKDKNDLIRIVKTKDNDFVYDPTGKANGRGAYICKDEECLNKFLKKDFLQRSYRTKIPSEKIEEIRNTLKNLELINADSEEQQ